MIDPQADFNAVGAPVTHGTCSVCGTKLYRMGRTPAHEGLQAPEKKHDIVKGQNPSDVKKKK